MPTPTQVDRSEIDFHRGEVLYSLANTYPNLLLTVAECIQNALDASGTRVLIAIDLKTRNVVITDNGDGVTKERFDKALASVGHGVKDKNSLGRFGRGLISPLNKCREFIFASQPKDGSVARHWTFVGEAIRQQHQYLSIPCQVRTSGLPRFSQQVQELMTGDFDTTWRTIVMMRHVTASKVVSLVDLDELESVVRARFSQVMYDRKASVRVMLIDEHGHRQVRDINPVAYSGEQLAVETYTDPVAGETVFRLYRSPKRGGERSGGVIFGCLDRPQDVISAKDFTNQARSSKWREVVEPALNALGSGFFEGTIHCKGIELHEGRRKFVYSDELETFYVILAQWFEDVGKTYFDNEQETTREERYQQLGTQSQQRLRDTLLKPEFARLWVGLRTVVSHGRLGEGHATPGHGRPNGLDASPSIRSGQGGAGVKRAESDPSDLPREKPDQPQRGSDRPGDIPTGVNGPRGQRRRLVKGDSQGLWFEYSWMEGNSRLWEFDFSSGVLTFNVRHPIWVDLDETKGRHSKRNDRHVMLLQEWIAFEMLCMLTRYPSIEEFDEHRQELDTRIRPYVEVFIKSQR